MDKETLRRNLSLLLMDTNITNPINCDIIIGEEEAVGLSTLEMPKIVNIFQEPSEGIIWFQIEGVNKLKEFDDIYDMLSEEEWNEVINTLNHNIMITPRDIKIL